MHNSRDSDAYEPYIVLVKLEYLVPKHYFLSYICPHRLGGISRVSFLHHNPFPIFFTSPHDIVPP